MKFYNETWFWTGVFGILGAFVALLGTLVKEFLTRGTQLKIERLKLHERESLDAYKHLYYFVCHSGDILFPPDDFRRNFISLMKTSFNKIVKPNMLFFTPEIREILNNFESQYTCLGNPDLIPQISFKEFEDKHIYPSLESLRKKIEQQTDKILRSPN